MHAALDTVFVCLSVYLFCFGFSWLASRFGLFWMCLLPGASLVDVSGEDGIHGKRKCGQWGVRLVKESVQIVVSIDRGVDEAAWE